MKVLDTFTTLALLGVAAAPSSTSASSLHFSCEVSGHGGCGHEEGGICVGAGIRDPNITLVVDIHARQIYLNKISGTIMGDDPIEASGERSISWRFRIIGLSNLRAGRDGNGALHLTLTDHTNELEFLCSS